MKKLIFQLGSNTIYLTTDSYEEKDGFLIFKDKYGKEQKWKKENLISEQEVGE